MCSYLFQAAALFAASFIAYGAKTPNASSWWKSLGSGCASIPLIVWIRIISDPDLPRVMLWVPLSGPFAIALAWWIDTDMSRTEDDIKDLDRLRYNFKEI